MEEYSTIFFCTWRVRGNPPLVGSKPLNPGVLSLIPFEVLSFDLQNQVLFYLYPEEQVLQSLTMIAS